MSDENEEESDDDERSKEILEKALQERREETDGHRPVEPG